MIISVISYPENLAIDNHILLHLFNNHQNPDSYFVSELLTEEGIQKETGYSLCHISRILKSLEKEGYVYRKLMRIENKRRKHNAFFLTKKGFKIAERIMEKNRIKFKG